MCPEPQDGLVSCILYLRIALTFSIVLQLIHGYKSNSKIVRTKLRLMCVGPVGNLFQRLPIYDTQFGLLAC
jgi:lipoprotein signal peptidase